jgi:tetratricopeptide (TPR) repeat protein
MKKLLTASSLLIVVCLQGCFGSLQSLDKSNQGAYLCMNQKEYDMGIAELDEAIKLDPKNDSAYVFRGYCYEKKEDFGKALNDYSTAVEIKPEDYSNYLFRANAYAEMKQIDQAQNDYDKAINLATKPEQRDAYIKRGFFYESKVENTDLALKDYEKARQLWHSLPDHTTKTDTNDIASLLGIIRIQSRRGNTPETCTAFEEYKTSLKWNKITDKQKTTLTTPIKDYIKDCRR